VIRLVLLTVAGLLLTWLALLPAAIMAGGGLGDCFDPEPVCRQFWAHQAAGMQEVLLYTLVVTVLGLSSFRVRVLALALVFVAATELLLAATLHFTGSPDAGPGTALLAPGAVFLFAAGLSYYRRPRRQTPARSN